MGILLETSTGKVITKETRNGGKVSTELSFKGNARVAAQGLVKVHGKQKAALIVEKLLQDTPDDKHWQKVKKELA